MLKLFHNDMSVCAQKVRMVLCAKELEWESEHLNLREGDQHKPEFLALNPKAVIPVLVHNDAVILESNIIVEYLEEAFPATPLMPESLVERAKTRWWLLGLDANLHEHVATISFCLAFRFQLLNKYPNNDDLQHFIDNIPDPGRRAFMRDTLPNGIHSPRLKLAVHAYNKLLSNMADALNQTPWLVGDKMTTADIGLLPYIERLDQLGLSPWWNDKPQINTWLNKLRSTQAYKDGIENWKNEHYLTLMSSQAGESWNNISKLL